MHGRDNLRRLDKILEIFNRYKVVSVEGNRSKATATVQTGIKKGAKNNLPGRRALAGVRKSRSSYSVCGFA